MTERELLVEEENLLLDAEALLLWYLYDVKLTAPKEKKLRQVLAQIALTKRKGESK